MTQILAGGFLGVKEAMLWFSVGVFCLALAVGAHAGEYFVALDGADTNGGSQDWPFRTIQKAADMTKPGDTCYVRGGIYREVVRPRRPGKEGKPICFRAWPGEVAVLCGTEPIQGKWSIHKDKIYKIQVPYTFDQLFLD